jgi:radical SAM family uncharacterized protein
MLDEILSGVMKPGRYIGQEWNVAKKDFDKAYIKFALCFPDLYEVGMSNLGVRILYSILNNITDVVCERFFAPGLDFENNLRKNNRGLFSLESKKNLRQFDIIGFSVGYELSYTNVLNILDLGSIPLQSSLRDSTYPLIVAGGPGILNPEPVHDFFDIFVIGEAEDAITELVDAYRKIKNEYQSGRVRKQEVLAMLSTIEGVYVPSLYETKYDAQGALIEFKPKIPGVPLKIKKRFVKDLDREYFPSQWLVPLIQVIHDRITLEIMRGCPNRCRFCQARQQYFPYRQKSVTHIFDTAVRAYKLTGYEEIALGGLSVSDYTRIEELLNVLMAYFKKECVGISLPSIKPKRMVGDLSSLIATIKKTGLTFAPEAASEKLRNILGKDFDVDNFFKVLEQSYVSGYQHVKLYFMIGIPYEAEADLAGIVDFAVKVSELRRKVNKYPAQVNVSVNTLIPKPYTPFQWFKMQDLDTVKGKQEQIKKRIIRNKKIKVNFHNRYVSFLEGVFSRGDRRLSRVIINAFKSGARFDAWEEHFKFEIWMAAFKEAGVDPDFYLRERRKSELLPWDFLDVGVSKESLIAESSQIIES